MSEDIVMKHAIACRMFDDWTGSVEFSEQENYNRYVKENNETSKAYSLLSEYVYSNFIIYKHYKMVVDSVLLNKIQDKFPDLSHLLMNSHWNSPCYDDYPYYPKIYTEIFDEILLAEKSLKFAEDMVFQKRDWIILTLPANPKIVKALSNYENNKSSVAIFMENRYINKSIQQKEFLRQVEEFMEIAENLVKEKQEYAKEITVNEAEKTVYGPCSVKVETKQKTLCNRLTDWWRNV